MQISTLTMQNITIYVIIQFFIMLAAIACFIICQGVWI